MKLKSLTLTVAVLAALSLAAFFLSRPPRVSSSDPRIGQPLVTADTVQAAAELKLVENGKTVRLKKQPDNTWLVASYYDFPADFGKLAGFVRNLTDARIQRFVTANPERFSRLDFKDSAISLFDAQGKSIWSLTLGKTADTGGRFVHFADEQRAYLAKLNAWIDTESRSWTDSTLLHFKPADIVKVEVGFANSEPVIAQRAKAEDAFAADTAPAGQQIKAAEITNLLRSLSELRFTDTTATDDPTAVAAAQHDRAVTLTTFAGETLTVKLGRKPEEKKLKAADEKTEPKTNGTPAPAAPESDAKAKEPAKPEYETIPAGPVFAVISSSDPKAPINALMQKRAFKVADYAFTSLPKDRAELFEPIPPPPPPAKQDEKAAPRK